jgi:putative ABC transport system permease protein
MSAVFTKARSDLRRRKLQSAVIAVVIFLSSASSTLALNLLVESDAPYDHAFEQVNGPHLTLRFAAGKVSEAQLRATAHAPGVTQTSGPWLTTVTRISVASRKWGGTITPTINVVGRDRPDTQVDRLTMIDGRWATAPGEVVLAQSQADLTGLGVGSHLDTSPDAGGASLLVVGIAASIDPHADAWVGPGQVAALSIPKAELDYQMLYRVNPAGTTADLKKATDAIAAMLPQGAVNDISSYLAVKIDADRTTAVMIPFLLAFSGFALLAGALTIANIVAGVVIVGYREIGIMKSVGFAPGQVVSVLLVQIIVPALLGCLAGVPAGMGLSQPFLTDTAHAFGLPSVFTASVPVVSGVFLAIIAISVGAALYPATQAGRMSAVAAITAGSALRASRSSGIGRVLSDMPLPRAISLGLGDAFARPLRSVFTVGAVMIGVGTVVFALGLHESLGMVAEGVFRDQYAQVQVRRPDTVTSAQMASLLASDPGTARFVAFGQGEVRVPGIANPVSYYGYDGDSSWLGYAVIEGRWFSAPGEVVAPTHLLRQANLKVGDGIAVRINDQPATLKIVGEYFDQTGDNLLLRGQWTTLAAAVSWAQTRDYEVQVKPGVNPNQYAGRIVSTAQAPELRVGTAQRASESTPFLLINGVVAGLAMVLAAIAVAGVFNTVVLNTREQVRDIAILKAVGMTPGQVVSKVIASVTVLGLFAGALGIPFGLVLHRQILQIMAQIASDTRLPESFYNVLDPVLLPALAMAGVAVAAIGAWLPANWAAHSGVAEVLQAE